MYPSVKVRAQEEPVPMQKGDTPYIVRVIESLSLESHSPRILVPTHASRGENGSYPPHARISKSHPNYVPTPSIATPKGKINDVFEEDNKINIRASSVPPPRAVLSSPDNDEIIGSQNQQTQVKQTPLRRPTLKSDGVTGQKNQLTRENRTITRRQTLSPKTETQSRKLGSPHSSGKVMETGNGSFAKGKHSSELSAPRQRPPFKVG